MPQLQLRDLPSTHTYGLMEGFSVHRPAEGSFCRGCDDWHNGHEVIMKSDCAATAFLDCLLHIVKKGILRQTEEQKIARAISTYEAAKSLIDAQKISDAISVLLEGIQPIDPRDQYN